jgi:hypothetical protein
MTPDQWREHREWIEEHVRCSMWDALQQLAARGELHIAEARCTNPTS